MNTIVGRNLADAAASLQQIGSLDSQMIASANAISNALLSGNKLMACGNGGSAADASNLTTEFVSRFNRERRPYPAISLSVHGAT